jgi:hypothetical protein
VNNLYGWFHNVSGLDGQRPFRWPMTEHHVYNHFRANQPEHVMYLPSTNPKTQKCLWGCVEHKEKPPPFKKDSERVRLDGWLGNVRAGMTRLHDRLGDLGLTPHLFDANGSYWHRVFFFLAEAVDRARLHKVLRRLTEDLTIKVRLHPSGGKVDALSDHVKWPGPHPTLSGRGVYDRSYAPGHPGEYLDARGTIDRILSIRGDDPGLLDRVPSTPPKTFPPPPKVEKKPASARKPSKRPHVDNRVVFANHPEPQPRPRSERKKETRPRRGKLRLPDAAKPRVFYVPRGIDLKSLLDDWYWHGAYFVNLIRWKSVKWRCDDDGYVRLSYRLLERIIPREILPDLIRTLVRAGVIVRDGKAQKGVRSMGYQWKDPSWKSTRVSCPDEKLNKTIQAVYAEEDKEHYEVHHWLRGKIDLLDIDPDRAGEIIATLLPPEHADGYRVTVGEYRSVLREQVERVGDGEVYLKVCEFGRVHTPLTTLARELLPCLRVRVQGALTACPVGTRSRGASTPPATPSQGLCEIDVSCCQPLLGMIFAARYLKSSQKGRIIDQGFATNTRCGPYHAVNQWVNTLGERGADLVDKSGHKITPPPSYYELYGSTSPEPPRTCGFKDCRR